MADTLILTRPEIAALVEPRAMLAELRVAFVAAAIDRPPPGLRIPAALPPPAPDGATAMVLLPGAVAGIPAYTVKVHAKVPGGAPAIQGVIVLHDLATGHPLAILESTLLTALRTGLAGALGADALARPDASRVAIVGAGAQGVLQLEALTLVRRIEHVWAFDTEPALAEVFAAREGARLGLHVEAAASLEQAVEDAQVVVTSTWAREPFLFAGMVRPGAHVTTLGPDQPGKCELDAGLLREALVVVDDHDLALRMGAVGGAGLGADAIHAELGEVLAGQHPGRTSPEQVTVLGAVGLPFQDLVASWFVYQRARQVGRGTRVALLGT